MLSLPHIMFLSQAADRAAILDSQRAWTEVFKELARVHAPIMAALSMDQPDRERQKLVLHQLTAEMQHLDSVLHRFRAQYQGL